MCRHYKFAAPASFPSSAGIRPTRNSNDELQFHVQHQKDECSPGNDFGKCPRSDVVVAAGMEQTKEECRNA
jgi:hypothetical protein